MQSLGTMAGGLVNKKLVRRRIMFGIKRKSKEGDPRVTAALDALEIHYEVDKDGDFRFGYNLGEGRSQMRFIRSDTYEFAGVEIREVFSVALRSMGPFDARTCGILLEQYSQVKIGSWAVVKDAEDSHLAMFVAKIAADLDGESLLGVIGAVMKTADDMEHRLAGRDDF
jgi:hypothetical protein